MQKMISFINSHCDIKTFANGTTMHGFKELYFSKKLFWKSVWIIIIMFALGLTIYQVTKSIQQFRDQPTVTTIQPLPDGKMLYPPIAICYSHWSGVVDLHKVADLNMSKSTFLFGLSYLGNVFSQETFNETTAHKEFESFMYGNNFTTILDFYFAISDDTPRHLGGSTSDVVKKIFSEKTVFINGLSVSYCYIADGENIAKLAKMEMLNMRKGSSKSLSFQVEKTLVPTLSNYLSQNEYEAYVLESMNNQSDLIVNEIVNLNSLPFPVLLSAIPGSTLQINPDIDDYQLKLVANVHNWQNQIKSPCIEGVQTISTNETCILDCISSSFGKNCEYFMVPFANDYRQTCRRNVSFAKVNRFEFNVFNFEQELISKCRCRDINRIFEEINECTKTCINGCEKWDFDVTITFTSDSSLVKKIVQRRFTTIDIDYPTKESILFMSEIDSQSWETFVANVGGLLGIWLGASIVTFFQTFYLCCCSSLHEEQDASSRKQLENRITIF